MKQDGGSTSFVDGEISKEGLFLLPDTSDFACSYVPERRQIFAFFGHPHKSPVPIFIVSIGCLCNSQRYGRYTQYAN